MIYHLVLPLQRRVMNKAQHHANQVHAPPSLRRPHQPAEMEEKWNVPIAESKEQPKRQEKAKGKGNPGSAHVHSRKKKNNGKRAYVSAANVDSVQMLLGLVDAQKELLDIKNAQSRSSLQEEEKEDSGAEAKESAEPEVPAAPKEDILADNPFFLLEIEEVNALEKFNKGKPTKDILDASSWLGRKFRPNAPEEFDPKWTRLVGKIKHHIALSGVDAASKRLALQRLPLWLNAAKVDEEDSLTKSMEILDQFFEPQEIHTMRLAVGGWEVLKWFLDCLLWIPRMLWTCIKYTVKKVFGEFLPAMGRYEIFDEEISTIEDWCSDFWSDKILKLGNALSMPRNLAKHATCLPQKFLVGVTCASESIWCPRLCIHNESKALVKRQLLDPISTPEERSECWKTNLTAFEREFKCPVTVDDVTEASLLEEFLSRYPVARRDCIRRSFRLTEEGHYMATSYTNAFVKREWNLHKDPTSRDPRCISAKLEDYLACTAPHYYHMMKSICKSKWGSVEDILHNKEKFIYTGGLTPDQIGAIVHSYEVAGYYFYEGDYSRYDAHNEVEALDAEFAWYSLPDTLKVLLKMQLSTNGGTRSGIRFSHKGKVASGVINTSFGNTLRGFMMIAGFCAEQKIEDYVVIQLGDDNVLMFREPIDLESLRAWTQKCGHKLEVVERPDVDFLEYCSMRFWNTGETRVLGPKPGRILAKTFVSHDPNMRYDQLGSYVQQVALGMRYYTWVPVLGCFLWKLMEKNLQGKDSRKYDIPSKSYEHRLNLRLRVEVDRTSVANQFFKIYGFDPEYLEEALRNWEPKLGTHIHHPLLDSICVTDGSKNPLSE